MNRYSLSKKIKSKTGKTALGTTIVPTMAIAPDDIYIQTTTPDRLDKLSNTFYGTPTLWWLIASANGIGKGTLIVPANSRIRIPSQNNVLQYINNVNNAR
jgi:hypothetical protein